MKLWRINCYDPHGRYVDHTGHFYLFRWMAKRAHRRYWSGASFKVPMYDLETKQFTGEMVPLCNYRVEKDVPAQRIS